jgi:8-oxo-dGTP pyrophosphatase MutT (NUDIX family)
MDLGESTNGAAIRETEEETGIACEITGLVGIYTNPRHVIVYTSNGEARAPYWSNQARRPGPAPPGPYAGR